MNDLMALKGLENNGGMSPYEQVKIGHMQTRGRASGVGIAGLVLGCVGTVAGVTAWIFSPLYASSKAKEAKEAEKIVSKMQPQPSWSKAEWERMIGERGLIKSSSGAYNECALYVTMCMICSDSGETISKMLGVERKDNRVFDAIFNLALDKLEDEDKMFDIRRYFHMS